MRHNARSFRWRVWSYVIICINIFVTLFIRGVTFCHYCQYLRCLSLVLTVTYFSSYQVCLHDVCDWILCVQVGDAMSAQVCYQLMTLVVSHLVAFIIDTVSTASSAVSMLILVLYTPSYHQLVTTFNSQYRLRSKFQVLSFTCSKGRKRPENWKLCFMRCQHSPKVCQLPPHGVIPACNKYV